ncbi:MAG: hypothetical protein E6Q97_17870 [Desulfurellales bacterium]|nr:MAG: hypothetical protein E6Q97_17870 [Desulfurellales bacterium]
MAGATPLDFGLQQQRLQQQLEAASALRNAQSDGSLGQMVSGHFIPKNLLSQLLPFVQQGIGEYRAGKIGEEQARLTKTMQKDADDWVKAMPVAKPGEQVAGPPTEDGQFPMTKDYAPSMADKFQWGQRGQNNPLTKALAAKYTEDQLLKQPEREEARRARKEEKELLGAQRLEQIRAQGEQKLTELQIRLEDRALDRASREAIAAEANQLRQDLVGLQIASREGMAQEGNQLRRDLAEMRGTAGTTGGASGRNGKPTTVNTPEGAVEARSLLNEAERLLPDSTGSGLGALVDRGMNFIGQTNKGAEAIAALQPIAGQLISKMPRMEGPQSDRDVLLYKQMAGNLADPTLPVAQRQAALKQVRAIVEKYANQPQVTSTPRAGALPKATGRNYQGLGYNGGSSQAAAQEQIAIIQRELQQPGLTPQDVAALQRELARLEGSAGVGGLLPTAPPQIQPQQTQNPQMSIRDSIAAANQQLGPAFKGPGRVLRYNPATGRLE